MPTKPPRQGARPLAARITQLRRYVQSHVRPGAYEAGRAPRYDGLAVTWFDDTAAMRASAGSEAYARTREDEPNFIRIGRIGLLPPQRSIFSSAGRG